MMELDDIVARLLHGENDALAGLPIEPVTCRRPAGSFITRPTLRDGCANPR